MTLEIQLPIHGLNEGTPFGKHQPGTTTEMRNWWTTDPLTGRMMLAQRAGQTAITPSALASGRVHTLMECSYANDLMTYSNVDPVTVEGAEQARSKGDILNGVTDTFGSVYYLDGQNGIVKLSHDRQFILRIALPSLAPGETVRSLAVDSAGLVFAGVSAGTDPRTARLWCFEEIEDNKTQLLWELQPGYFTEALLVTPAGLYAAQNDTTNWQSRMALYVGYSANSPTLLRSWPIAYPVNDCDVSPIDGNVATAHPPLSNRGFFPKSPGTTTVSEDWTLIDLPNSSKRLWCWLSSQDVDGDGTNNANRTDGAQITTWVDKSGNGRHAFEIATGKGPVLMKNRFAGRDTLFFNGVDQAMKGATGVSTDILFRQLNRGLLPCHAKHQFVVVIAARVAQSDTRSVLFSANNTTVSTPNKDRRIFVNGQVTTAPAFGNANGHVQLYEEAPAGGAIGQVSGRGGVSGANAVPLGGCFDADGIVLLSWVFDHGYDDIVAPATRSRFRVNGRPADKWTSRTGFETLQAACIGADLFGTTGSAFLLGDVLEFAVWSDWYETSAGVTSPYSQQRLIEGPSYPDATWASGSKTELEKLEGVIAHRCGISHKLPSGMEGVLEATATPAAADTVTVDTQTYTFRAALTPAPNEVLIGADRWASLKNLHHAINGTGARGTAYASATTPHATFWSPGTAENNGAGNPILIVQARDARGTAASATTDTSAGLNWMTGATTVRDANASTNANGRNSGVYPHPYYLTRTADSDGGPPSTTSGRSLYGSLNSEWGLLCLWNATSGRLKNAITTAGSGTQTGGGSLLGLGFGGVGYGVRFLPDGNIISVGPRQALVTVLGVSADPYDIRKFVLTDTGFTINESAPYTTDDAWVAAPGAWDYEYPRMAVDKDGNVYVPYSSASLAASMLVYKEVASGASPVSPLLTVDNLTSDPKGRAVALDPSYPTFPTGYSGPRAELVYLFTAAAATTLLALHELRLVSAAPNNVPHIVTVRAAGVGSALYQVNDDGTSALIDAAAFASGARFVDWCFTFGRVFVTDGSSVCHVWDPKAGTYGFWRARSGGQPPKRPLLLEAYRNRIFAGPLADERNVLVASAAGDPFDWDFAPRGNSPETLAAWHSRLSETTADFPDNVTCLKARENDILVVGGERSIFVLRGDPMQGGQFDLAVRGVGIAFGRAGTFTPDGTFWFISDQGELRRMMPDALAARANTIPPLVSGEIATRLAAAIDFSVCRPELHYDPRDRRLHILLVKHSAADTSLLTHFAYELDTKAFTEVTYATNAVQPSAMMVVSGVSAEKRTIWLGGHDGVVAKFDPEANGDRGEVIDASMVVPLVPNENRGERWAFENFGLLFTKDSGSKIRMEMLETNNPDDWGTAVPLWDGFLGAGRNTPSPRVSGNWVGMRIRGNPGTVQRMALIEARCDAEEMSTEARL